MSATFRSFAVPNYRLWFAGALVSNVGTWMQRTAQDWIVLTQLTQGDAVAVGVTMSLQLGPQLLLVPWSGYVADRFYRRKLLMTTQAVMGMLGIGLGIISVTGVAQLWMVYVFALALGIASAFDAPARQAFVSELVPPPLLPNAVSLNSASFNGARLIGPAVAGVLTAVVGAGPVFLINGGSFAATLLALLLLRTSALEKQSRPPRGPGQLREGLRYVRSRPDIVLILVTIFVIGTFGMNFPIYAATMASQVFHHDASGFGLVSSVIAIGSVTGALLAARRERPRMAVLFAACGAFGATVIVAAFMPAYVAFAAVLVLVGFTAITIMTTANGIVQSTTAPEMRGRVMALYMAVFMGGTPIGSPIIGALSNAFGPRWAMAVGGFSGFVALGIGVAYWMVKGGRVRVDRSRRIPLAIYYASSPRQAETDLALDETVARVS